MHTHARTYPHTFAYGTLVRWSGGGEEVLIGKPPRILWF